VNIDMRTNVSLLLKKLDHLRTELVELAFTLEGRGRFDAADVAMTTSARIDELREELLECPASNVQRPTSSFAKATEDRSNCKP
jgi:hypothetical protein